MTHIVSPFSYKTKKAFKEAIKNGDDPYLADPSIVNPQSGRISELVTDETIVIFVTNHPKRSWFANLRLDARTGKIVVR